MIADSSLFIIYDQTQFRFDRFLSLYLSWKFLTSKQPNHADKFPLCAESSPLPPSPSSSQMKRNITYAPIPLACSRHPIGKMRLRWERGLDRVVRSLPDPFQTFLDFFTPPLLFRRLPKHFVLLTQRLCWEPLALLSCFLYEQPAFDL